MRRLFLGSVVVLAVVLVSLLPLLAAASPITFGHTWGTAENESATAAVVDSNGNVILAGVQQDPVTGAQGGFVAKFSAAGSLVWNRMFPFPENASLDMSLAAGGDVYVLGMQTSESPTPGPNNTATTVPSAFVARISSAGALVFFENFTEIAYPARIATDPVTGGFALMGVTADYQETIVASFDSTGLLRWARTSPFSTAYPQALTVDGSGRVFALLYRSGGGAALDAFDTNGNLLGQVVTGSFNTTWVYPTDLLETSAGPLVLAASTGGILLSQFTSSLSASWTELAQANGWYDNPMRLVGLSDGSFVALDNAYNGYNGSSASNVYHFSSTGTVLSGSSYVSPAQAQGIGYGFILRAGVGLSNGGLLLAGMTFGVMPETSSPVTVTTTSPGVSWSTDFLTWSGTGITVGSPVVTLVNPTVPVDDWNELAGYQAWYGETNLPASKLTVTVTTSQSSSSSTLVTFSTSVSGGRKPYTYSWSFGDGTFGTGATPSHTYPGTGRYLAQVTVTDSGGLVGYGTVIVTVTGPPSVLYVEKSPTGTSYTGDYISFYAGAVDPDGGMVTTYAWDFGDGSTAYEFNYPGASHVYATPGNYTVTVTVTDSDQGLSASGSVSFTILQHPDYPPVAAFVWYPYIPSVGAFVNFYGYYSYDPDGNITNYFWSFGDGSTYNSTDYYAGHAYASPGNYTVSLTVTDNAGLTGTMNATLMVAPDLPPVAGFVWYPGVPSVNQTVSFNAGYYSYDPDGYIVSWAWDFGDGSHGGGGNQTANQTGNFTDGGPFPFHVYSTFGTFLVTLTVTDNAGLSTSVSHSIYVNAPPVAAFTTSEPVGKAGTPLTFNAGVSSDPDGDSLSYAWSFGDGSTASGVVVSHVFAVPGQYLVTLVVSDPYTSSFASAYIPVTVPKSPVAVISWSPTHPVAGQTTVSFDGSNSFDPDGAITRYIWEFGDGSVGGGKTTTHVYASAGTYTLELIVVDEDGIANRDSQTITVVAPSKGTVATASAQAPIAGASVTLTEGGAVALSVETAADGSFSVGGLAPGTYAITISKPGYEPYSGSLVWDGFHGDLGTFVLSPVPAGPTGGLGVLSTPLALGVIAAGAAAGAGAAMYLARRRRLRNPPRRFGT